MIFDINQLDITILKKFDGEYNYFNPSHFNGRTIYRRESKFEGKILVSDIVDDQDNVLLQHAADESYLWSYEDARFIDENNISVCCCKRDKNDLVKIINVEYKKYNLLTKELTHFKTQNEHFEKHWQFYNDAIIYHVNPYILMDKDENILFEKQINWKPWIEKYGNPGLSTNVFEINGKKYLLFHSYKNMNGINLKYYCGVLIIDDNLNPIAYSSQSIFPDIICYNQTEYIDYFNWKRSLLSCPTIVNVVFPMNVVTTDTLLSIYAGLNDFMCIRINITKELFSEKINNSHFILV